MFWLVLFEVFSSLLFVVVELASLACWLFEGLFSCCLSFSNASFISLIFFFQSFFVFSSSSLQFSFHTLRISFLVNWSIDCSFSASFLISSSHSSYFNLNSSLRRDKISYSVLRLLMFLLNRISRSRVFRTWYLSSLKRRGM